VKHTKTTQISPDFFSSVAVHLMLSKGKSQMTDTPNPEAPMPDASSAMSAPENLNFSARDALLYQYVDVALKNIDKEGHVEEPAPAFRDSYYNHQDLRRMAEASDSQVRDAANFLLQNYQSICGLSEISELHSDDERDSACISRNDLNMVLAGLSASAFQPRTPGTVMPYFSSARYDNV